MTPITKQFKGTCTSHAFYKYSRVPNFHSFRSTISHFQDAGHLRQVRIMTPKWPLTQPGQRYPLYGPLIPPLMSQISFHFTLRPAIFELQGILVKCTKWPQNDHRHFELKGTPHMCATSTPESELSIRFTLWPAVLGLQAVLRQVDWIIPKGPWALQDQKVPHVQVFPSLKFHSVSLYGNCFRATSHFETGAPNVPKMTYKDTRSKVPTIPTIRSTNAYNS